MRVHVVWWLALILTLGGCIETDGPILGLETSQAPQVLTGLWGQGILVEPLHQRSLRVTLPPDKKGEMVFRAQVYTASLANGFYVMEHSQGLEIVRLDGPDRLYSAQIAPGVTEAQIQALARTHTTKIDLKTRPEAKDGVTLTIERIGNTDAKRLIALLNDMIATKMLVSLGDPTPRITDRSALEKMRIAVAQYDKTRQARLSAALLKLGGAAATRGDACSELAELHISGDIEATAQLGRCHLYGWYGDKKSPDLGFNLLDRAAWFGSATASYEIGKAYAEGSGGRTRDARLARVYLGYAASNGSQEAKALLAKMDAAPAAQAATPSAAEPMYQAVTIGPTNELLKTAAGAVVCTKDGFEVTTQTNVQVSLSDIVKPGQSVDEDVLEFALWLAEGADDDSDLREELAKYDFRKVDADRISQIFDAEWKPLARKYTAAQHAKTDSVMHTDLMNMMANVEKRYEASTGVTIDLEYTRSAVSKATTPQCRVAGLR